jgi:hypothetical protein
MIFTQASSRIKEGRINLPEGYEFNFTQTGEG